MKLRIQNQNLRFRLSPQDLDDLMAYAQLEASLRLSTELSWNYRLSLEDSCGDPEFSTDQSTIKIRLPKAKFSDWLTGHEIEWVYEQSVPPLTVSIEKDLKPDRN